MRTQKTFDTPGQALSWLVSLSECLSLRSVIMRQLKPDKYGQERCKVIAVYK